MKKIPVNIYKYLALCVIVILSFFFINKIYAGLNLIIGITFISGILSKIMRKFTHIKLLNNGKLRIT